MYHIILHKNRIIKMNVCTKFKLKKKNIKMSVCIIFFRKLRKTYHNNIVLMSMFCLFKSLRYFNAIYSHCHVTKKINGEENIPRIQIKFQTFSMLVIIAQLFFNSSIIDLSFFSLYVLF